MSAPPPPAVPASRKTVCVGGPLRETKRRRLDPVIIFLIMLSIAVGLTWVVPSGFYDRPAHGAVSPNGFHVVTKIYDLNFLWRRGTSTLQEARPASPLDVVAQIPVGFVRQAGLIFMVMFIGGAFTVLRATGAMDAVIDWVLAATQGNAYLVAPIIMVVLSAGSTLLGLTSEYLVVIPLTRTVGERLGLPSIFATAVVFCAAKVGYMSAVANPLPLAIAQPIVGVPVFSGLAYRFCIWAVLLTAAIGYMLLFIRRSGYVPSAPQESFARFPRRHAATLATLLAGIAAIAYGASQLQWGNTEFSAFYIMLSAVIGLVGGLGVDRTVAAFVEGLRSMCLAAVLIGLAGTLIVILSDGLIVDTIIHFAAQALHGQSPAIAAQILMAVQMMIDIIIPATTAQAAASMPIVGSLAQLLGVSGQISVIAFLLGSGVMAFMTPTSAYLPAYLATGGIGYGEWMRFILPFVAVLAVLSSALIAIATAIGY